MNKTLTEKLDELKELALKATPSPWRNTGEDQYEPGEFILGGGIPDSADEGLVAIACRYGNHPKDKDNADYIAAVDPDTVLTLIAEMQKLKKENELIQSTVDNAMGDANAFRAHAAKLTRIIQEAYSLFSLCWHRGHTQNNSTDDLKGEVNRCLWRLCKEGERNEQNTYSK